MEFFFFFLPLLFSLPIFIYLYLTKKSKIQLTASKNSTDEKLPLPPGSTGWPFIGETIDYISKAKNGIPQDFVMERIKKYSSKVFKTSIIGQPMAILYGAEGNKFLFCNERKLVQVWFPPFVNKLFPKPDTLSNHSSQEITKIRKKFAPLINGEGLQKIVGTMDSAMRDHLQTSWDRKEIKVCVEVRKYTVKLALLLFLGVDDPKKIEELSLLLDDLTDGISSLPVNVPGTSFSRAIIASKLIIEEVKDRIKQRKIDILENRVSPTQDVLCYMLITNGENGVFLEECDIISAIRGLLFGGYGNLNTILIFIMKYLAELPHVYYEVLREQMDIKESKEPETLLNWDNLRKMKYSWNVACEVMRLQPAVGVGMFREALTDFTYAGCTIPKGWKLHWVANLTHKNPEYFPDPEKFDPSRFDGNGPTSYAFVPFGGGSRMCPGSEYVKAAILVFMHNVVTKFKWEKVNPNEEVIKGPIPKCPQGLPIRLYPRKL